MTTKYPFKRSGRAIAQGFRWYLRRKNLPHRWQVLRRLVRFNELVRTMDEKRVALWISTTVSILAFYLAIYLLVGEEWWIGHVVTTFLFLGGFVPGMIYILIRRPIDLLLTAVSKEIYLTTERRKNRMSSRSRRTICASVPEDGFVQV